MNINWLDRILAKPRDYQYEAVSDMLLHNKSLLQSPTGSGKTNIAIYLIMALAKKTIVVVSKTDLINQTYDRFLSVTNIKSESITIYKGLKPKVGPITLITWQSLASALKDSEKWQLFNNYFDCVVCDEAHKTGVHSLLYTQGVQMLNCTYQYGLSATPYRQNGETKDLIRFYDSNVIDIPIDIMYKTGALIKPHVDFVYTGLTFDADECLLDWQKLHFGAEQKLGVMKKVIGTHRQRNEIISRHIHKTKAGCNIVLSFTTEQTDILHSLDGSSYAIKIYGKMGKKDKLKLMKQINNMELVTVYATQSFLGEGTDIPKLQNLYITTPFAGGSKTVQFAGRVLRPYKNKNNVTIYDYCDYINYDPYNNKKIVNHDSWTEKRAKEYLRLRPNFRKLSINDY